jgi:hypothetical protein
MPEGEVNVNLPHVANMRDNGQPHSMSCVSNLDIFRYSAKARYIRLDKPHRASVQKGIKGFGRVKLFAERERYGCRLRQSAV